MKINRHLIWDYSFTPEEEKTESFQRWYISRVLQRGGIEDIQGIGLPAIERFLPQLSLPRDIRDFWDWVLSKHQPKR